MIRIGEVLAILVLVAWFGWSMVATALYARQRQLLKGLDNPILLLSRRERRQYARDLLMEQLMERQTGYIEKGKPVE